MRDVSPHCASGSLSVHFDNHFGAENDFSPPRFHVTICLYNDPKTGSFGLPQTPRDSLPEASEGRMNIA
jgi:hypothetical protein